MTSMLLFRKGANPARSVTSHQKLSSNRREYHHHKLNNCTMKGIISYFMSAIVCFGAIGSFVLLAVVFRSKILRKFSCRYYVLAFCMSEAFFLLSMLASLLSCFKVNVLHIKFACQSIAYLSGLCNFLSVWLVKAFTMERFIAMQYPDTKLFISQTKFTMFVIIALTATGAALNIPWMIFVVPQYSAVKKDFVCDVDPDFKVSCEEPFISQTNACCFRFQCSYSVTLKQRLFISFQ